jgi:hypothetical protein
MAEIAGMFLAKSPRDPQLLFYYRLYARVFE